MTGTVDVEIERAERVERSRSRRAQGDVDGVVATVAVCGWGGSVGGVVQGSSARDGGGAKIWSSGGGGGGGGCCGCCW